MIVILLAAVVILGYAVFFLYEAFKQKNTQYNNIKRNFLMLYDWMDVERSGNSVLASFLQENGYDEIIIYGWGYLGNRLYRELENTQIKIKGILDRKCPGNIYNIPSYSLQSDLPKADAVIVTVLYDGEKIKRDVEKIIDCPVINLEELIGLI